MRVPLGSTGLLLQIYDDFYYFTVPHSANGTQATIKAAATLVAFIIYIARAFALVSANQFVNGTHDVTNAPNNLYILQQFWKIPGSRNCNPARKMGSPEREGNRVKGK
jgi:hypothetical protein